MSKSVNFDASGSVKYTMEKKDIIILAVLFATIVLNLYLRQVKKKKAASGTQKYNLPKKGSISAQPDDYEPYSKK